MDWPSDCAALDNVLAVDRTFYYENLHQNLHWSIGRRSRWEGIPLTVLAGMRSDPSCVSKARRRKARP